MLELRMPERVYAVVEREISNPILLPELLEFWNYRYKPLVVGIAYCVINNKKGTKTAYSTIDPSRNQHQGEIKCSRTF